MLTSTEIIISAKANHGIMNRLGNALVREKLLPVIEETEKKLLLLLNSSCQLVLPYTYSGAFSRYQFETPFYIEKNGETIPVNTCEQLLLLLKVESSLQITDELREELINSRDNLKLAYKSYEQKVLMAEREQIKSMLQFLSTLQNGDLPFSEALVTEGHPLHPSTKTKLGLSEDEVQRYAPEFQEELMLKPVLVHRSYVVTSEQGEPLLYQECPAVKSAAEQTVSLLGERIEDYHPFIVHPWQFEHVLPVIFSEELEKGVIIPLAADIPSSATLSFRTMSLTSTKVHAKLPVNVQATSAVRTVSPEISVNGPLLSERLVPLMNSIDGLTFLPEAAGAYFGSKVPEPRSRQLSYILRQSPDTYRKEGEVLLVGASLTSLNPLSGEPVVMDLIRDFTGKIEAAAEDVYTFARHYSEKAAIPLLKALLQYGAGLEAHMQNTILAVKNGQITNVIMRDLGGVRIHKETISHHISLEGIRDASIFTDNISEANSKFIHAFVQNHLGDLWFTLSLTIKGVTEDKLWDITSKTLHSIADGSHEIFAEKVKTKALLSMRMKKSASDYEYSTFANPLDSREG
ncbi:IucA/IucC family protein [Fictibacillus aquaticus]|uniref:Siderophore biosynthesis protein n=1 Tax=Fictibacillus aquaticus TaxID=2021314 RepID=A0A235F4V3_9BACL|nr:IucA/IucC family protein [Fictibacillus aquaticus]OYD56289.1 hypothetical protein CGZ90_18235 [Fictibacillus aquaticus]